MYFSFCFSFGGVGEGEMGVARGRKEIKYPGNNPNKELWWVTISNGELMHDTDMP